jgi:adenine modification enzyme
MENKYILSDQISLYGEPDCIGFGNDEFYIKEIERSISVKIIKENHYSKKIVNSSFIHLGVFENKKLKGVLQFGYLFNPTYHSKIIEFSKPEDAMELNRMWLSDEIIIKYPESRAISYSIKFIKRKYPKIKWIQSFADERCGGFGIVYQACSFSYYGEHIGEFYELEGEIYHSIQTRRKDNNSKLTLYLRNNKDKLKKLSLRQFRYIKFLDQREKKKCLLKEMPYPKHYK